MPLRHRTQTSRSLVNAMLHKIPSLFPWKHNKTKIMAEPVLEEDVNLEDQLAPCTICGRTFLPNPLSKHSKICEKNATKKRKVFNSLKQRVEGTDLAPFHQQTYLKKPDPPNIKEVKQRSTWKEKHQELVITIREAKNTTIQEHVSTPHKQRSLSIMNANFERCLTCDRQFGPKAYDRHVEWCKERKNRLPQSPANIEQAKQRLEARIKYRVPPMSKPKVTNRERYQSPMKAPPPSRPAESSPMSVKSSSNLDRRPSVRKSSERKPEKIETKPLKAEPLKSSGKRIPPLKINTTEVNTLTEGLTVSHVNKPVSIPIKLTSWHDIFVTNNNPDTSTKEVPAKVKIKFVSKQSASKRSTNRKDAHHDYKKPCGSLIGSPRKDTQKCGEAFEVPVKTKLKPLPNRFGSTVNSPRKEVTKDLPNKKQCGSLVSTPKKGRRDLQKPESLACTPRSVKADERANLDCKKQFTKRSTDVNKIKSSKRKLKNEKIGTKTNPLPSITSNSKSCPVVQKILQFEANTTDPLLTRHNNSLEEAPPKDFLEPLKINEVCYTYQENANKYVKIHMSSENNRVHTEDMRIINEQHESIPKETAINAESDYSAVNECDLFDLESPHMEEFETSGRSVCVSDEQADSFDLETSTIPEKFQTNEKISAEKSQGSSLKTEQPTPNENEIFDSGIASENSDRWNKSDLADINNFKLETSQKNRRRWSDGVKNNLGEIANREVATKSLHSGCKTELNKDQINNLKISKDFPGMKRSLSAVELAADNSHFTSLIRIDIPSESTCFDNEVATHWNGMNTSLDLIPEKLVEKQDKIPSGKFLQEQQKVNAEILKEGKSGSRVCEYNEQNLGEEFQSKVSEEQSSSVSEKKADVCQECNVEELILEEPVLDKTFSFEKLYPNNIDLIIYERSSDFDDIDSFHGLYNNQHSNALSHSRLECEIRNCCSETMLSNCRDFSSFVTYSETDLTKFNRLQNVMRCSNLENTCSRDRILALAGAEVIKSLEEEAEHKKAKQDEVINRKSSKESDNDKIEKEELVSEVAKTKALEEKNTEMDKLEQTRDVLERQGLSIEDVAKLQKVDVLRKAKSEIQDTTKKKNVTEVSSHVATVDKDLTKKNLTKKSPNATVQKQRVQKQIPSIDNDSKKIKQTDPNQKEDMKRTTLDKNKKSPNFIQLNKYATKRKQPNQYKKSSVQDTTIKQEHDTQCNESECSRPISVEEVNGENREIIQRNSTCESNENAKEKYSNTKNEYDEVKASEPKKDIDKILIIQKETETSQPFILEIYQNCLQDNIKKIKMRKSLVDKPPADLINLHEEQETRFDISASGDENAESDEKNDSPISVISEELLVPSGDFRDDDEKRLNPVSYQTTETDDDNDCEEVGKLNYDSGSNGCHPREIDNSPLKQKDFHRRKLSNFCGNLQIICDKYNYSTKFIKLVNIILDDGDVGEILSVTRGDCKKLLRIDPKVIPWILEKGRNSLFPEFENRISKLDSNTLVGENLENQRDDTYNPILTAERQLMELLECDDFKAFTPSKKSAKKTHNETNTKNTKKYKRASVIDPPTDFQDKSSSPDVFDDNFELIENFINDNLSDDTILDKLDAISLSSQKAFTADNENFTFCDELSIDPRLINEYDNLSIPDNLTIEDRSPAERKYFSSGKLPTVLKSEKCVNLNEMDDLIASVAKKQPQSSPGAKVLKTQQSCSFGSGDAKKKNLSSLKRSISALDPVKPKNLRNKEDVQTYFEEQEIRNSPKNHVRKKEENYIHEHEVRSSPKSNVRKKEENYFHEHEVRSSPKSNVRKKEPVNVSMVSEELFSIDDEMYEEYKKYEQMYLQEKEEKMKMERRTLEDDGQISKISADSAYGSLSRNKPKVRTRITKLSPLEPRADSASSSGSETSIAHNSAAKFCHECGSKYPLNSAKFCVECGVKRLVL